MNPREQALMHFGILGMHWGKRKSPQEQAAENRRLKYKQLNSSNPSTVFNNRAKFSPKELDRALARLKMERDFRNLDADYVGRGSKMANTIIGYGVAMSTAYGLYKSPLGQKIESYIKTKFFSS